MLQYIIKKATQRGLTLTSEEKRSLLHSFKWAMREHGKEVAKQLLQSQLNGLQDN